MAILVALQRLASCLPLIVLFIIILDLAKNQSLFTQYLHWITYLAIASISAILTGKYLSHLSTDEVAPSGSHLVKWATILAQNLVLTPSEENTKDVKAFPKSKSLEESIQKLSSAITEKYIQPWSYGLHADLGDELNKELSQALLTLASKLTHIDSLAVWQDSLAVFRRHLLRLKQMQQCQDEFAYQHPVNCNKDISREKFVEVVVEKLLVHLNAHRRLTSNLIFNLVKKVIAHQVILKLLDYLKNPQKLAQIIECLAMGKCTGLDLEELGDIIKSTQDESQDEPIIPIFQCEEEEEEEVSVEVAKKEIPKKLDLSKVDHKTKPSSFKVSNALGGLFCKTADNIAFQSIKFSSSMWKSDENLTEACPPKRKNSLKVAYEAFRKLSHHEPLCARPRSYTTTPQESPQKSIFTMPSVKRSASSSAPLTTIESGIELNDMTSPEGFQVSLSPTYQRKHSSDEDSLKYEDTNDLESTIMKLRQLLADKSAEDSVSSSDDIFLDPKPTFTNIKVSFEEDQDSLTISHDLGIVNKKLADFANLQVALECNPDLHCNISKLKSLEDLVGCNASNDAPKAKLLENWLVSLSDDSLIGSSMELNDFLSPIQNNESKKSTLARKMTGVLSSIKDALPTFDDEPQDNDSHDGGNRGFLLTGLFPVTPSSPCKESFDLHKNGSKLSDVGLRQKKFKFYVPTHEKSELEATLDFHVQHLDQSMVKEDTHTLFDRKNSAERRKEWSAARTNSIRELCVTKGDPALSLLGMTLVDLPDLLLPDDYQWLLSKEVVFQPFKVTLGPHLSKSLEQTLKHYTTLEAFIGYIECLSSWITGSFEAEQSQVQAPMLNLKMLKLLSASFEGYLKLDLVGKCKHLTQWERINEDFLLSLIDLWVAHILFLDSPHMSTTHLPSKNNL